MIEENKQGYFSLNEIIGHFKSFSNFLRKKIWLLLLTICIGAGVGTIYYFNQKPKYQAVTTFILEEKNSGSGGLAGLASQFGFNVGSLGGGGSLFSGDNILDILKSKKVILQVLLSPIDNAPPSPKTLADLYIEFSGLKKKWQKKPALAGINFLNASKKINPIQDSVLNVIYESIVQKNLVTERTSKQGTIIKVQITAEDCTFARLMTERLIEEASKLYLDIRTGTALSNIMQLQRRSDSLLTLLNRKSFTAASSQPLDYNPGIRTAIVPVEIATRDKTVLATLYAEVTKNLEASKLILSQQTPVIQLLDEPGYLLNDNKKGLSFLLLISTTTAGLLYLIGAFLFFMFYQVDGRKFIMV